MIRHHTSYQGLRCISPAFPASRPHRDHPAAHTRKRDITPQKSANLRAVVLTPNAERRKYSAGRYAWSQYWPAVRSVTERATVFVLFCLALPVTGGEDGAGQELTGSAAPSGGCAGVPVCSAAIGVR